MGGVFLIIQMEMFIKENLKKILQMVMENIIMRMVLYIMGIGQMILSLGQDMKYGMTLQIIMEIIKMVKKMEQEHIYGQIKLYIKENGKKILFKDLEFISL